MYSEVRRLWELLALHDIDLTYNLVPSTANLADAPSRCRQPLELRLHRSAFVALDKKFGPHTIIRLATRYNTHLSCFNAPYEDLLEEKVDGFAQDWASGNNFIFPDPDDIPRTLLKFLSERANATIILPRWESQPW